MGKFEDLSERRFGRIRVLIRSYPQKGFQPYFICVCDCGRYVTVQSGSLKNGSTQSCGCYGREQITKSITKHGKSGTIEYRKWYGMHTRCSSPKSQSYKSYGAKGITVCEEWKSFETFYRDMGEAGEGMSLERKDSSKGYCPENCEWIPLERQQMNRCTSIIKGTSLRELAETHGKDLNNVKYLYHKKKMSVEDSIREAKISK